MKKLMVGLTHSVNLVGLGAQILGAVPQKPWVMVLQSLLAAFAPSFGGMGHKIVFGTNQDKD
jgi:hypothetical protein